MKINELRIGNYIEQPNGINNVFIIEKIEEEHLINTFYIIEVKPIELTMEWFMRFGFIKVEKINYDYWQLIASHYTYFGAENPLKISISGGEVFKLFLDDKFLLFIKYVHQLQNLYFSLTGNELIIDPKP